MAKIGKTLIELATEIERRAESKRDYIVPVSKLHAAAWASPGQGLALEVSGYTALPIDETAHGQLAEFTGIPLPYFRKMIEQAPELAAANVNRWLADRAPADRRMVRTLDGRVRALLSDSYRPLENEDLANAVLPVLNQMGVQIISCEITDRRLYIKAVDQSIQRDVPSGKMLGDQSHAFFDTCAPAIAITNSEIGMGRLGVETGVLTKMCTNLAWIGAQMKKYHTGSRADVSDDVYALLSDKTRSVTDEAVWRQVQDVVRGAFAAAQFDAMIKRLGAAAADRIVSDPIEVIERVGKRFSFSEGERKSVLRHLIEGGDLTRYGVHSAVTRAAQDLEGYDRATEFERAGGEIIELAAGQWRELAPAE